MFWEMFLLQNYKTLFYYFLIGLIHGAQDEFQVISLVVV